MEATESIGQRIKQVRGELSQKAFGARIGLSQTAVTALETNQSEPRLGTFNSIVEAFSVNPEWLRTGKGEMKGRPTLPVLSIAAEPAASYATSCIAPAAVLTLTAEVAELRAENKDLKAELKQARREAREDLVSQARLYTSVKDTQTELVARLYAKLDEYELRLGIRQPTTAERERQQQDSGSRLEVKPFGARYREETPAPTGIMRALYPPVYSRCEEVA